MTWMQMTRRLRSLLAVLAALALLAGFATGNAALAQPHPGLTTHVLDTVSGKPAAGVTIDFGVLDGETFHLLKTTVTNADGRNQDPLLTADTIAVGRYELIFHVGEYYAAQGVPVANPAFLDKVPVVFAIADPKSHYHVPLLLSPWSYTTYRGS